MSGKLTFGFHYDFRNPAQWRRPSEELYSETLDIIAATEALGFGAAYLPEHHLAADGYVPGPLIVLAAIAARTKSMRLGTGVALAPLYHPVRFAEDAVLLDILSNGRLDLGLGIGYRKRETAAFGTDFSHRGVLFDEFLQIVTRLWAGETIDFEGRHLSIKGAELRPAAPRGRIPMYIGGFSEKALDRVLRHGDGYIGTADTADIFVEKLRERGSKAASLGVRILALGSFVARDPEAATEELAPYFLHTNNDYARYQAEDQALGREGQKFQTLEEFKANGDFKIQTPDELIATLKEMQSRMSIEHYVLARPPGLPAERFLRYAEDFARDVIPAFT